MAMSMIVTRIYHGETAEEIGIPEIQYNSWKETLNRFLGVWDKNEDFEESFRQFLLDEQRAEKESRRRFSKPEDQFDPEIHSSVTMPATKEQVSGFFRTARDAVKNAKRPLTPKDVYEARVEVCDQCPFLSERGRCGNKGGDNRGCGCFMKNKARLNAAQCPRGYWKE